MGLLDLFTGNASRRAATQNAAAIAQGQTQANNALTMGANQAIGALGTTNGWLGGTASSALNVGFKQARDDLGTQYDATQTALGKLGGVYDPLVAGGGAAYGAYNDAIGANGPDGNARATTAFRASPGYQYSMDQALDAVQRTAAARGGLAGGNTTADILKTATGLSDQNYQQYVNNLQNGAGFLTTGLAGKAAGYGAQAAASQAQGTALGALGTGLGAGQAGIYGQGANIYSNLGQNQAGVINTATNQTIQNNIAKAQADNAAGANILGAVFGGLNTLSGGAGSAAGRSGGGSGGLFGLFGSGGNPLNAVGAQGALFGGGGYSGG